MRSLGLFSVMAVLAGLLFSTGGAQAAPSLDRRQRQADRPEKTLIDEVFLAFDSPAPTNASDPCRTGETFKQNEIDDRDDITVCTFDSNGDPAPTDTSSDHLVWSITDIQGAPTAAVSFDPAGPPSETTGAGASAHAVIEAQQTGEVLVTVLLMDSSGHETDSFSIEKQVGDPCPESAVMEGNNVVLPDGAIDVQGPVDVDEDLGLVTDIYPDLDTSTDEFYASLPCEPSLDEGELPTEATEGPTEKELEVQGLIDDFEAEQVGDIVNSLLDDPLEAPTLPPMGEPGPCSIDVDRNKDGKPDGRQRVPCDSPRFLQDDQPFEGRDIVFVHGLATEHLSEWIVGNPKVHKKWPAQPAEFLNSNGYFREYAENYWVDHIREHLFDPGSPGNLHAGIDWSTGAPVYKRKSNRYLAVAWSSNQTLEYAQHAFLAQIRLAIQNNKNVVTSPVYPSSFHRPFGSNGLIIISHSTGGLIVSTALSRAAAGDFGSAGRRIARRARLHVAFNGAISGSRIATVGMAVALAASPGGLPPLLCDLADALELPCIGNLTFVSHSILRDLIPAVAQLVWGYDVGNSPVPTLTVAGGHPMGNHSGLTKFLLPGLDDGVVSMNSACGNSNPVQPVFLAPSGMRVASYVKAYDRGIPTARAVKNFISHLDLQSTPSGHPVGRYLAGACTPYLSPTGMLMPVDSTEAGTPWDTRNRYGNHFSFIQGSMDHSYEGGSDDDNPWPSSLGDPASTPRQYLPTDNFGPNCEEMSAITDPGIYRQFADGTYLVNPSFQNEMHQVVRGRKIEFKLFKWSKKTYTFWIWRRNYFLLDGNSCNKSSSHYVYRYVGRR